MANWRCPECGIVLDAVDEGRSEACPFCGLEMDPVVRVDGCNTPEWVSPDGQSGEDGACFTYPG